MTDSLGMLVAAALGLGAEAAKTAVGEGVKDAYKALKAKVAVWAAHDVAELEKTPGSAGRKDLIAEAVDGLSDGDKAALLSLARGLTALLQRTPPVGLEIGRLRALDADLGRITVTEGVGARVGEVDVGGTFRVGDITVGK